MPNVPYPNPDHFINSLVDWAAQRPLFAIYSQKGGWEGWAQVELAFAFLDWLGGSNDREVPVYTHGQLCDILNTGVAGGMTIFELKCQSFYQDEGSVDAFANAFIGDLDKINHTPREPEYQNARATVIGIGVGGGEGSVIDRAIEIFSSPAFFYVNQTFWTQAQNGSATVFYAEF